MMFRTQQKERLSLEKKLTVLAERYHAVTHPRLKMEIDAKAKNLIRSYPTQSPAYDYHIQRYERFKWYYER